LVEQWDLATGKVVRELGEKANRPGRDIDVPRVSGLLVSPDGKTVTATNGAGMRQWDTTTGKEITWDRGQAGPQASEKLSRDGRTLAALGNSPSSTWPFCLWETVTGKERARFHPDVRCHACAFAPGGTILAVACSDESVRLWDPVDGKELHAFRGNEGYVTELLFLSDGRLLTALSDSTILIWDLSRFLRRAPAVALREEELPALWENLLELDGRKAFLAIHALARRPEQSVPFLRSRLQPVKRPEGVEVARWIQSLDADEFAVREQAMADLAQCGETTEAELRRAASDEQRSAEVRRRAKQLLAGLGSERLSPSSERLRSLRALEVLEHIGTPEAAAVLKALAGGAAEARLTQEAKASLARLVGREAVKP
jgi:hypothetical protein